MQLRIYISIILFLLCIVEILLISIIVVNRYDKKTIFYFDKQIEVRIL